jgi:uncharacterized protein YraI
MQNHLKVLSLLSAALVAAPLAAAAQQLAYASKEVNLRAGPSRDYPVVATLGAGTTMTIFGCLENYRWCDVVVGRSRGWVYSGNIVYPYLGRNVPVMSYGSSIGLGIVSFSIGNYWDNYYTDYPWYAQRQNWDNRPWLGYGSSGYGTGYGWRAPAARVGAVTLVPRLPQAQVRPVTPGVRPPAQVRPVTPQRPQAVPPRAQVPGVGRTQPPGQAQRCNPNDANCVPGRNGAR